VSEIDFTDPVPESAYAKVALTGTGGVGKTWTALLLARGMAGEHGTIGLVDTEHQTATKYRKYHEFKVCNLDYYDPKSLITAVARATERGIGALIVDSFSHFWSGAGGILAQVDQKASQSYSGNNFAGWKDVRPMETEMMSALLSFPGHLIVTMRVKAEYVLETQANGRTKPVKIGLKPEQREGVDYEWDLVGGLDTEHVLTISKTRLHEIDMGESIDRPGIEFGARIAAALREGATPPAVNAAVISQWRAAILTDGVTRDELGRIGRDALAAGALGVIITDLAGKTVSVRELINQQWRIAPEQARPAVTLTSPAAPASGGDWTAAPARAEEDTEPDERAQELAQLASDLSLSAVDIAGIRNLAHAEGKLECTVIAPPGSTRPLVAFLDFRHGEAEETARAWSELAGAARARGLTWGPDEIAAHVTSVSGADMNLATAAQVRAAASRLPAAPQDGDRAGTASPAAPAADDPAGLLRAQIAKLTTQQDVNKARTAVSRLKTAGTIDEETARELNEQVTTRWGEVKREAAK
jgi:hypothetical protein